MYGLNLSSILPSDRQWNCPYLLYDLGIYRLEIERPTYRMRGERCNRLRLRHGNIQLNSHKH